MGSCICKNSQDEDNDTTTEGVSPTTQCPLGEAYHKNILSSTIDKLVSDTLNVIETIVDNEPDPPSSILLLHAITERPSGWIELIYSLMRVVPVEHPMGPSVITLLLDDSPLPTKHTILKVANIVSTLKHGDLRLERNFCVILGCLAEKLAGPNSISLLNESTLDYLISNISEDTDANIKLLSIIALEKFAQTSENKTTIKKSLQTITPNPLEKLEQYSKSCDFLQRQIGFCARWCLDNYFINANRQYSYEVEEVSHINAMLNSHDVSEYLKIAPDGLEARCDAYTFESVRCTFQTNGGSWYYEVLIITPGVMQIGWATKNSSFLSDDGYGIGDDKYSIGFDGCRKLIWHNAKSFPQNLPSWKSGTILGCLLSLDDNEVIFYLNGVPSDPQTGIFENVEDGFFAAASFMSFQQCRFNFGTEPFRYAPTNKTFKTFNEYGNLLAEDKVILPRHLYLDILRQINAAEDSCTLCFDRKGIFKVQPCQHSGFCKICIDQLKFCPMCRREIQDILKIADNDVNLEAIS